MIGYGRRVALSIPPPTSFVMRKRDAKGRYIKDDTARERFVAKCRFDPGTGCVVWTGAKTSGQGKTAEYGAFWYDGRRWFAHRWAARYIHGQEIDEMQVDHCCPHGPNTLCVQHVQSVTPEINRELQWVRRQVGHPEYPWGPIDQDEPFTEVPFHKEPDWMKI